MLLNLHSVEGSEKSVDGGKVLLLLIELGADPRMTMMTWGQISDS
jgi:hypothetical protein